jgi:hypothetical protein
MAFKNKRANRIGLIQKNIMKKIILFLLFGYVCLSAIAQVKTNGNAAPAQNNNGVGQSKVAQTTSGKGGASLGKGPKAKATAVFMGKSSGTISLSQLANALTLDMSDKTKPSSFQLILSCSGVNNITYENSQNNELTKEMKELFASSKAGCTITFSNIIVNGNAVNPIKFTVQ